MASKALGLVPQAAIVAACYAVLFAGALLMPNSWSWIPAEQQPSAATKAWNLFTSVIVAAVVVTAVNCSVVGNCGNLAWAYAAYSVATLIVSFLMFWFLSSVWRQMTPEQKANMNK